MRGRAGADFSFSGLKTAVRHAAANAYKADLAASYQSAVIDILLDRIRAAMDMFRSEFSGTAGTLVVAGGVAANGAIRAALTRLCEEENFAKKIPPPGLCTDNAAMVAWAGVERSQLGLFDALGVTPKARWPLQDMTGGGSPTAAMSEKLTAGR
jgi:N6-L-threonylcarbamoyladenine synthase